MKIIIETSVWLGKCNVCDTSIYESDYISEDSNLIKCPNCGEVERDKGLDNDTKYYE